MQGSLYTDTIFDGAAWLLLRTVALFFGGAVSAVRIAFASVILPRH